MVWVRAAHSGHRDPVREAAGVVGGLHVIMPDITRLTRRQEREMSVLAGSTLGFYGAE